MEKNVCISVYLKHLNVELALSDLKMAGVNLQHVSIIGRAGHESRAPVGLYNIRERLCFLDKQGDFWGGLSEKLSGTALFWTPGFGSLVATGPIISKLVNDLEGFHSGQGFSVIGLAFFKIGVPRNVISEYEQAIRKDHLILIIQGEWKHVEKASKVLHAEHQQVTVHHA